METKSIWRQPSVWIGIGISLLCLAGLFWILDLEAVWNALQSANYWLLAAGALATLLFQFLRAWRWRYMLSNDIPLWQLFHIQNIGYMLNYILPLRMGDAARGVLVGSVPTVTFERGISTMVVERVLDLLFITALFPFTLATVAAIPPNVQTIAQSSGYLALAGIVVLIVAANQRAIALRISRAIFDKIRFLDSERWVSGIDEILRGLDSLTRLRDGVTLTLMSIMVWIPIIYSYYVGLLAVGIELSVLGSMFVVCMAAFSIAAPSSPGGVGVFHAGMTLTLVGILGFSDGPAGAFALLFHAMSFVAYLTLGLIGTFMSGGTLRDVLRLGQAPLVAD